MTAAATEQAPLSTIAPGWEAMLQHPDIVSIERGLASVALRMGEEGPITLNHSVIGSYPKLDGIKGIELYDGRSLGATRPGDEIHLPAGLKDDYPAIARHYREIGLEVTDNIVWNGSLADLANRDPVTRRVLSVFLFGEQANAVAPNERRYQAVKRLNNKNRFIEDMQEAGLPTPETLTLAKGAMPPTEQPNDGFNGPWFVKGAVAASGEEVIKCNTWEEVLKAANSMKDEYQVQNGVDADDFLNVQYYIKDGKVYHVATTGQILDGPVHAGNRHPSKYNPRQVTDKAAVLAAAMGAEGLVAFDVAAVNPPKDGSKHHPYQLIECNPRPNGSSYPTTVAEKLGVRDAEWAAMNIVVDKRMSLAETMRRLKEAGVVFDPKTKTGATVVNWGTSKDGKLGILFVGPQELQTRQVELTKYLLSSLDARLENFPGESWIDH